MLFLGNYTSNIATKKFFFISGFRAIGIKVAENKDYLQQDLFKRVSKPDECMVSIDSTGQISPGPYSMHFT